MIYRSTSGYPEYIQKPLLEGFEMRNGALNINLSNRPILKSIFRPNARATGFSLLLLK